MGCGCGKGKLPTGSTDVVHSPSAAPKPSHRMGAAYGTSMLTGRPHLGAASNPATNNSNVKVGHDTLQGVTAYMRASVRSSRLLDFERPVQGVVRGEMGFAGALIVQAANAIPVVSVGGYNGQMPLLLQPQLKKPYPWGGGSNGA